MVQKIDCRRSSIPSGNTAKSKKSHVLIYVAKLLSLCNFQQFLPRLPDKNNTADDDDNVRYICYLWLLFYFLFCALPVCLSACQSLSVDLPVIQKLAIQQAQTSEFTLWSNTV